MLLDFSRDYELRKDAFFTVIEEMVRWYVDNGGRLSKLELYAQLARTDILNEMGFKLKEDNIDSFLGKLKNLPPYSDHVPFVCVNEKLKSHCQARLKVEGVDTHSLYDLIGRIDHDSGNPKSSIESYTSALLANPKSAVTFRNLGAAYHASGDLQLAFASYQQAIQLDSSGKF